MDKKVYTKDRKFKNDRLCSLEEVAKELGISIERVRVIEKNALNKCKSWCDNNGYDLNILLAALISGKESFTLHDITPESMD